jgi:hypothetical protein
LPHGNPHHFYLNDLLMHTCVISYQSLRSHFPKWVEHGNLATARNHRSRPHRQWQPYH